MFDTNTPFHFLLKHNISSGIFLKTRCMEQLENLRIYEKDRIILASKRGPKKYVDPWKNLGQKSRAIVPFNSFLLFLRQAIVSIVAVGTSLWIFTKMATLVIEFLIQEKKGLSTIVAVIMSLLFLAYNALHMAWACTWRTRMTWACAASMWAAWGRWFWHAWWRHFKNQDLFSVLKIIFEAHFTKIANLYLLYVVV
jgi:hypothetical protein